MGGIVRISLELKEIFFGERRRNQIRLHWEEKKWRWVTEKGGKAGRRKGKLQGGLARDRRRRRRC